MANDDLAKAIQKVRDIRADAEEFDGDRRGHYEALQEAEKHLVEVALKQGATPNPPEKPDSSGLRQAVKDAINREFFGTTNITNTHSNAAAYAAIAVVAAHLESKAQALPMGHETPSKGCSTYNWLMHAAREIRAPARKE